MADAKLALVKAQELYKDLAERRPQVTKNERYASGIHPLTFATKEWGASHRNRYAGFSDNWCGVVGSAPAERTKIEGFRLGADTEPLSDDERALWETWERNDGPAQSAQGFQTSTIARRSFALVWGDENDDATLSWEHPSQVIVDYSAENRRVRRAALKVWVDDKDERMTLYTAEYVWKWRRPSWRANTAKTEAERNGGLVLPASATSSIDGNWEPYQGRSDDTWPISHPLGRVPMVEFPNRPTLSGGPVSDIEGTMAMQDAVNLLWAYLFVAADYASMPARVISGAEPPKIPVLDSNGVETGNFKPVDIESLAKGRMMWLTGEAKAQQWDAARLDVFTNVINIAIKHIAAQTRTPIYLIHGELGNVNGETLTGLDAPLVSKVRDGHTFYTSPVREVFSLMASAGGNEKTAIAARSGMVKWHNPALASDAQIADAALKSRQVGIPMQVVLESIYGYDPGEVDRIIRLARDEALDPYLAAINAKGVTDGAPATS